MAMDKNGESIQAPEVNAGSFIGQATDEGGAGSVITLLEAGNLKFMFPGGDKEITNIPAGMSFVAGLGCTGITSTASILIS